MMRSDSAFGKVAYDSAFKSERTVLGASRSEGFTECSVFKLSSL